MSGPIRAVAAIASVLPGMLLDALVMARLGLLLPDVVPGAATYFGRTLLLACGAVFLAGFVSRE